MAMHFMIVGTLVLILVILEGRRRGMSTRDKFKGGLLVFAVLGILCTTIGLILVFVLGG